MNGDIIPNLLGVWAYETSFVPLQRTEKDGRRTDVLFWNVEGKLHVHPDRREKFDSVCSFLVMKGGADTMTDKARAEFGLPARPFSFTPEIDEAMKTVGAELKARAERRGRLDWFVPLGARF